ncbi:MAG TPA: BACON domain-containing carbohydrate-binding protein, partial [Blastocatellia bacterium]|nr:BACON domain-containing carbohydrate-binding protein [Blastocatellia bacterium]
NKISQNQIASNSSLGIDLGPQGVTENPFNQLTGANNLQNFPVLTSAAISGTQLTVSGSLQASPLTAYTIEFFLGQSCGQLGHQNLNGLPVFLGSATVTTDGTGNASVAFSVALPSTGTGAFVNATATDPKGNTSEFCECIQATQQCPFTLTPSSQLFGPAGGLGSVALSGSSTCSWTAVSQAPWLTVQSGSSGSGPGTVTYLAAPNQGSSARTGSLVIAGIPFTVTEQVTGPTISGARVSGQNLIVSGQGFDQGSVILLNSQAGKTRFRNSGVLVGKKLANQVQIGQTVTVQVVTSTNVLSPAFSFTRAS